jgi:hypothetical protein
MDPRRLEDDLGFPQTPTAFVTPAMEAFSPETVLQTGASASLGFPI